MRVRQLTAMGGVVFRISLALGFSGFHPSTPFVVGEEGDGEDEDDEEDEEPIHRQLSEIRG